MNVSHMSTERLEERLREITHQESYGKSIDGQNLLHSLKKELQRRREMHEQCSEDCGDCNGCAGAVA